MGDPDWLAAQQRTADRSFLDRRARLDAATGDEVARWEATQGFASSWVWEDETHLLVNAYEQGQWRAYRLGVDDTSQQILSISGPEEEPAFTLLPTS